MAINKSFDVIVIGSGMGGMTAATMLANSEKKVLVLEAAHALGGCSSSYTRKKYTFESGATTLIGFDENQPLKELEDLTGIYIPREEISPSMRVKIDGDEVVRYKDKEEWIKEAGRVFGNEEAQRKFWTTALAISDVVWKVSLRNPFFPPRKASDWLRLFTSNSPFDVWVLPYALKSTAQVMKDFGVYNSKFKNFVDEQLMITAQSKSEDTPFLFGAAGLTYTNYSNFYVPGGLIEMINSLKDFIIQKEGELHTKEAVSDISQVEEGFLVQTKNGKSYQSKLVVSNIPIWNMQDITSGEMKKYFEKESRDFDEAWGAITCGIVTTDCYPDNLSIHHQIHIGDNKKIPNTLSESLFVSMSMKGDEKRAQNGMRTLNISCHASPEYWFSLNGDYERVKEETESFILEVLKDKLPGFKESKIQFIDTATPVSWEKWVYRKKGRVGGIPQSMARSLLKWTPNETPFFGLYLVGDTTYPGQGIPGVTLSGLNVYWRIKQNHKF